MATGEIITVIMATAAALVSVVNAISAGWGRTAAKNQLREVRAVTSEKLDQIHMLTNSNLTSVKDQLAVAMERIDKLEQLLQRRER